MALIERYFSVDGTGDGTAANVPAALFSTGNWSTIITGFDFSGTDALRCRIMPGDYTCTQAMGTGLWANPPSIANSIMFHGASAAGVLLAPPDPQWLSCMPAWDEAAGWDSGDWPVITCPNNVVLSSLGMASLWRLLKVIASGQTNRSIISGGGAAMDWCRVDCSSSNSSPHISGTALSNCIVDLTATTYAAAVDVSASNLPQLNNRITGVAGSSGVRHGVTTSGSTNSITVYMAGCTIAGFNGAGFADISSTTASRMTILDRCTIAGNLGGGIVLPSTASQTLVRRITRCLITGNTGYGIDAGGVGCNAMVAGCRLRDNTSGNFANFGNYPTDLGNLVTDSDDATEYVDADNGDYRIKAGAAIWGKGYGVADEAQPTLPPASSVWSESAPYGYASDQISGLMQWDDIANLSPENVRAGVVIGEANFTGTLALPTEAQVQSGVGFGADGTEFEGTLVAGGGGPMVGDFTGGLS